MENNDSSEICPTYTGPKLPKQNYQNKKNPRTVSCKGDLENEDFRNPYGLPKRTWLRA
jgi:hypothetical protein